MDEISKIPKRKGSDKAPADRSSKLPKTVPDPIRISSSHSDERSSNKAHKTDSPRVTHEERRVPSEDKGGEDNVLRDKVRIQWLKSIVSDSEMLSEPRIRYQVA